MQKRNFFIPTLILILIAGNITFITSWVRASNKLDNITLAIDDSRKTASFLALFVEKVLKAESEVSFEDRLKLENDVRGLNDDQVFKEWKKFIESRNAEDAQSNLKDFISIIVNKI